MLVDVVPLPEASYLKLVFKPVKVMLNTAVASY